MECPACVSRDEEKMRNLRAPAVRLYWLAFGSAGARPIGAVTPLSDCDGAACLLFVRFFNLRLTACARCLTHASPLAPVAHSPYGRAAYANVNGLDSGSVLQPVGGSGPGSSYHSHQEDPDEQQQQQQQYHGQDFGMGPASPTRRVAPPPPSRASGLGVDGTYQPRPPPPVPAEAMASLNIGVDKSGSLRLFCFFCLFFFCCCCCSFFVVIARVL